MSDCRPTVAEIDLAACADNLVAIRAQSPDLAVWAVVKADAYGHGAVRVARHLEAAGADGFCVATVTEGAEIRRAGIARPILVIGPLGPGGAMDPFAVAVEYGLAVSIPDSATAEALSAAARSKGLGPASVHIKIDTGMGRLGAPPGETLELARSVDADEALSLDGLLTNLATADAAEKAGPARDHLNAQLERFGEVCRTLAAHQLLPAVRTIANSSAIEKHPSTLAADLVTGTRPGLALYGATLSPGPSAFRLQPVMRLFTRIHSIRHLGAGVSVGYGVDTVTRRPTRVAVLPLGYHDGLPRALGRCGKVWVRGRRAQIIGRISMDITLVDVTAVSAASPGDEVVLFGGKPDASQAELRRPISVAEVAAWAETIPHEILCRIGARVPRRYLERPAASGVA